MPSDAITVLLVSEQAEDVKMITKCLRSFYLGCRLEAVYSSEEALEWASKQDWHLIIVDEPLLDPHAVDTLQEIRRRAPRSGVVVAAARQDTAMALDLRRQGADYALFKNTPTFLAELPVITREVLEKRQLLARLELAHDRYLRLIDNLTDVAYELDAEGRFLYVSRTVRPLLHYDPEALIGLHYSKLILPEDLDSANRRFNERRAESRATRRFKLRVLDRDRHLPPLMVEINATALYDRHHHFIGTVGLLRPAGDVERVQALQRLTDLPASLALILSNTEQLLRTVQALREQPGLSSAEKTASLPSAPRTDEIIVRSGSEQAVREAPPVIEERRQSPRIEIHMAARATADGMTWEGTALNIALGGIYILFKGQVLASEHQLTRLGFGSEVGVLEIPGIVRHIQGPDSRSSHANEAFTGLAIQFSPLKEVEGKILQSLIEGLHAQSISMTCTALLIGQSADTSRPDDLRLETQEMTASTNLDATEDGPKNTAQNLSISTEVLQCTNEPGQRIALCHDHRAQGLPPAAPIVIVAPGYGRTKREYIELAYYFASNGCRVLRYDHSYHVGESDGGMVLTTLTRMHRDLEAVIDYAVRRWPEGPLAVVASDVMARVAIKAVGRHASVKLLVLLAPVFDLQYTLMAVHQEDVMAASVPGMARGIGNILGFNIDVDAWMADAILGGYADFRTTREDLAHIHIPTLVFSSEQDLWTRPNALSAVQRSLGDTFLGWHAMSEAGHGIVDHPDEARPVFRQMVAHCRSVLYPLCNEPVRAPSDIALAHQARVELEHARLPGEIGQTEAVEFWRDYLDRSHSLVNFSEYWHMLDHIHRLLGPLDHKARILDAGCGNGNFGMFLLIAASFRPAQLLSPDSRLHYIGVDFVFTGLQQAKTNIIRVAAELRGKFAATVPSQSVMKAGLTCVNLNARLPFHDGQFDRVVCNLVLGYLRDPLFTLRELIRVLAPRGKLVLTHFKPQANFSHIYRAFVSMARSDLDRQQAKEMVEASDQITKPVPEDAFRFFDRQELAMLLMASGASQPRIYSTFANQAYIAVAEKAASPPTSTRQPTSEHS